MTSSPRDRCRGRDAGHRPGHARGFGVVSRLLLAVALPLLLGGRLPAGAATLRSPPAAAADLNEQGVAAFAKGRYTEALRHFRAALDAAPGAAEIRENLGKTHSAIAARLIEEVATSDGGTAGSRRALEQLQQALLHWRGDADTYHALGWCHLHLGEPQAARDALERATQLAPRSFKSLRLLGVAEERLGHLDRALAVSEAALTLRSGDELLETRVRRLRHDREALRSYRRRVHGSFAIRAPREISDERIAELARTLQSTAKEFSRRWGVNAPAETSVICYPPGAFSRHTGLRDEVGGAFDGRIRIAFPAELEAGGLTLSQVARHETIHMLLRQVGERPPRWLDEGLAQLLDGEPRPGWDARFLVLLRREPTVGIEARQARFQDDRADSWAALYLHAHEFARHLAELGGEFRIDMLVREVGRGSSWGDAFRAVYGTSAAEVDRRWRRELLTQRKRVKGAPDGGR